MRVAHTHTQPLTHSLHTHQTPRVKHEEALKGKENQSSNSKFVNDMNNLPTKSYWLMIKS